MNKYKLIFLLLICLANNVTLAQNCTQGDQGGNQGGQGDQEGGQTSRGDNVDIPPVTSVDPNEIVGLTGYGPPQWVQLSAQLSYTIFFENDPDFATAPAQRVEVRFAFDEHADMYSFGLGSFGFGSFVFPVEGAPNIYQQRLDVRDSLGIYVDVVAGLDVMNKEAFWIFSSIDPLTGVAPLEAMSGFLPVNDKDLRNGEGFVTFVMKPAENCQTGDVVPTQASIVFDTNEAIETNIWENTIDADNPVSQLSATQDEFDLLSYNFTFQASDAEGSGVKQIIVYGSENKQAYREFAVCTPDSIWSFTVEHGGEYAFYSIAEDNVGNREAQKDTPEFVIASNSAPADLLLSNTIFTDDTPLNGFVGEFSTVDLEGKQHFVYELTEGEGAIHNDLFTVSGSQLLTGNSFKCSDADVLYIRAKTTDAVGLSLEKTFTLNVERVYENVEPVNVSAAICEGESYSFFGQTCNKTGTYTHVKPNAYACDSIYTLDLRVNPAPEKPIVTLDDKTLSSSSATGNQWYDLDGKIEGAVSQTYTPKKEGTYYVIVTSGNCISEKSDNVNVYWTDNISTVSLQGIYLYPNPAKDMVTIHIPDPGIKQIFISDLTGRLVLLEDVPSGIENVQLDISSLHSESHYIVEVGSTRIKLIVK